MGQRDGCPSTLGFGTRQPPLAGGFSARRDIGHTTTKAQFIAAFAVASAIGAAVLLPPGTRTAAAIQWPG
jgi:hypothetical protein